MRKKTILTVGILASIILSLCLKPFAEWLLTDSEKLKLYARQKSGRVIEVNVTAFKKGFFVDGGHAWSFGSLKESYKIVFSHLGKELVWEGPGMPFILQQNDGRFYLATFDRESGVAKAEFRCFVWNGDWISISQDEFPKNLAINNLLKLRSDEEIEYDDKLFRITLLARFWFCISNKIPYWKVSDSMIKTEFTTNYHKSFLDESLTQK